MTRLDIALTAITTVCVLLTALCTPSISKELKDWVVLLKCKRGGE